MNLAETARAAADHIERVGLNQDGDFFKRGPGNPSEKPCCVLGAVSILDDAAPTFGSVLHKYIGWHIKGVPGWNDSTPQPEVLATLRAFADSLDGGER